MRRIYDSEALRRDDDAFTPNERDDDDRPQSLRSINGGAWSRRLLPQRLCFRAIGVEISTPRTEFPEGEPIPFAVTMKNALPVPVSIRTNSPLLWTWNVDGDEEAARVPLRDPPDESGTFAFDRGERKQFRKRWRQLFRVTESEWEPAAPGEYTIGAGINVDDPAEKGLYDETTIRIVPDSSR
ncbi:hypothetical protein SAMN06269185_0082 [Natronoarchaeum philippinense]|uniref:DUF7974 domain-containing protein n=1 Tax=Natronoarchaeum philippinense TaxID=558529 RepID=A0A285MZR7_NATPI|nr:hypothetical protein [Natronoarchaeum philippinense]SNZ02679.1 hypothetical protein SAMN06269185_0082 [Natronoarchaeum philippinense]